MTTYSVTEVARAVSDAVDRAFPEEIWVHGEIRDLKRAPSGHVYFNLIDPTAEGGPGPILPVTLFASEKFAVNRVLQRSGAVRMTDGVAVRIRGLVGHYAARGTVQLRMTWIDTDYTLGTLAAARERLIKSLDQRGLLRKNRAVPLPLVPLAVGLITSAGSAADADFTHELERSGYSWQIRRFDARVQGNDAVADVVRGLAHLAAEAVDAIAVVRGGGAQTDLAAFDAEEIAVAIANCPVPVLTGIGHETDTSVADLVATSFKTPTACAAALVDRVTAFTTRLDQLAVATRRAVRARLYVAEADLGHAAGRLARSAISAAARAGQSLTDAGRRIRRGSRLLLARNGDTLHRLSVGVGRSSARAAAGAESDLDRLASGVAAAAQRSLAGATRRMDEIENGIGLMDPVRLLARGWSITRDVEGNLVVSPEQAPAGTVLRTTVAGGGIESVVKKKGDAHDG